MSNWQECVVVLLLLLCAVRISQNIYIFFRRAKDKKNPCANCATGCELKQLYDKKRAGCSEGRKDTTAFSFKF